MKKKRIKKLKRNTRSVPFPTLNATENGSIPSYGTCFEIKIKIKIKIKNKNKNKNKIKI